MRLTVHRWRWSVHVYIAINKQIAQLHIRVQAWIHISTFNDTDASIQLKIILLSNVPPTTTIAGNSHTSCEDERDSPA